MAETSKDVLKLSIECVDDADVFSAIVVYDDYDVTFPISYHRETTNSDGQGRHRCFTVSSVTAFQFPFYEDDVDIPMSWASPGTDMDPNPSLLEEVEEDE